MGTGEEGEREGAELSEISIGFKRLGANKEEQQGKPSILGSVASEYNRGGGNGSG